MLSSNSWISLKKMFKEIIVTLHRILLQLILKDNKIKEKLLTKSYQILLLEDQQF